MNNYIGHQAQLFGVEEHRLVGGKGDGMRLFEVNNGRGLMFTISADRAGDISRLYYNGHNLGFFAPCGYVSPQYYEKPGLGFLKSFTAGFFTTCGLTNVGGPCTDGGDELSLHGNISHCPAESVNCWTDDSIHVKLTMRDASLFSHKLLFTREYICPLDKDEITIRDTVKNIGDDETPYMILYHFNMGYPLLSESSEITIASKSIKPKDEIAAAGLDKALVMEEPQSNFAEQCFFYDMEKGMAKIYNPDIKTSLSINYDTAELPYFTEWKLMSKGQYVLGLEPGNCLPVGRSNFRKEGDVCILKSGEEKTQTITIKITSGK